MNSDKKIVYILACLACITISFNVAAVAAAIPVISGDLMLADFRVAQVVPFYMIPYGVGALLYAPLTRYFSYRAILIVSIVFFSVSSLICARGQSLEMLLVGRMGMGVTAAGAIPLGLMIIGDFFDKSVRGRLVGLFFSSSFLANFAGIAVLGMAHWRFLFYIPALLGGILIIGLMTSGGQLLSKIHGVRVNYLESLSNPRIFRIFIFIFFISFLYHGVQKWYGVYLSQEYGLNKQMISLLFIISMFGGFVGQNMGGYISDKKGRIFTCYLGIYGLAAGIMLLLGHYSLLILGGMLFMITAFWTIGHNGVSTVLTDFPNQDRPVMASLNSSMRFFSGGLGFLVSSPFVQQSFGLTFFIIGALTFLLSFRIKSFIIGT